MSRGTDRRTVRVAPELWERAGRVAVSNDETLSDVMRRALDDYADDISPRMCEETGGHQRPDYWSDCVLCGGARSGHT